MRPALVRQGVVNGLLWGCGLAVFAVSFGVLGLTPSLTWIPELPLLVVGAVISMLLLAWAGRRTVRHSGERSSGFLAGALAGAVGGVGGGMCYVAYGKPVLNVAV